MRKCYLPIFMLLGCFTVKPSLYAQVGIGTKTPNASAVLDLTSTNKGFLPPRMTSQQRDSIGSPVAGLTIWCYNCGSSGEEDVFNGIIWINITGTAATSGLQPSSLALGKSYLGGTVAYIYQPGDSGYVSGEVHGIIATAGDVGYDSTTTKATTLPWSNNPVKTNAVDTGIGQGDVNTNLIIAAQGTSYTYAAEYCKTFASGGPGWYLPDSSEIKLLYNNALTIGGFAGMTYNATSNTWSWSGIPGTYWTSNAIFTTHPTKGSPGESISSAVALNFQTGSFLSQPRGTTFEVRPIKKF